MLLAIIINIKSVEDKMKTKVLLSWSSGKDSAWTLYQLQQSDKFEVVGLFCTINQAFDRVAMHGTRQALVEAQAKAANLPIQYIKIPNPCSNEDYDAVMQVFIDSIKEQGIDTVAFGDLFLQDIRDYRESRLQGTGIKAIFPLWGADTTVLSKTMIDAGLEAVITCLDPKKMPVSLAGAFYNHDFIKQLPEQVNVCGEYGEFHSFAFNGPMFSHKVKVTVGQTVERDGFVFTDIT